MINKIAFSITLVFLSVTLMLVVEARNLHEIGDSARGGTSRHLSIVDEQTTKIYTTSTPKGVNDDEDPKKVTATEEVVDAKDEGHVGIEDKVSKENVTEAEVKKPKATDGDHNVQKSRSEEAYGDDDDEDPKKVISAEKVIDTKENDIVEEDDKESIENLNKGVKKHETKKTKASYVGRSVEENLSGIGAIDNDYNPKEVTAAEDAVDAEDEGPVGGDDNESRADIKEDVAQDEPKKHDSNTIYHK